jgi:hypothetical protein
LAEHPAEGGKVIRQRRIASSKKKEILMVRWQSIPPKAGRSFAKGESQARGKKKFR